MSAREPLNATAPLGYHLLESFVFPFQVDELGTRSVKSGVANNQERVLSVLTVHILLHLPFVTSARLLVTGRQETGVLAEYRGLSDTVDISD